MTSPSYGRRGTAVLVALIVVGLLFARGPAAAKPDAHWVVSWGQAMTSQVSTPRTPDGQLQRDAGGDPVQQVPTVRDVTVRQRVRLSLGGKQLRLRLSNVFGETPLRVDQVQLAKAGEGAAILPGSSVRLTFHGKPQALVPAGGELLSDPVAFDAPALTPLSVSLYFKGAAALSDAHPLQQGRVTWAVQGNAVEAANFDGRTEEKGLSAWPGDHIYAMTAVEVAAAPGTRAVVTFGDSITDGYGATTSVHPWPAVLAQLGNAPGATGLAVANMGISADELAFDQVDQPAAGIAGLKRYYRDVIDRPGVTDVVVLFGANDINRGPDSALLPTGAHARELIASYRLLADVAHQRGLKIWAGTVLPFSDDPNWYSPRRDATRVKVNAWLKDSGAFDGVIDFADAVEGPYDTPKLPAGAPVPQGIATVCVVDEGVHPNDRGYAAMGAVAFNALTGSKVKPEAACRMR
ncbi:Lysophospholipase L1 [Pseudoxanthomonas sp. GM95]|uniref:GDSL-type esterase/lipase family protein n=1 Tax=Pseudoxanthomonas sp. GM95 TaxID=1881043 RepID=UPI0008B873FB|nr:GDSL-type esterase/lipase family protein [Pseudoxanthomonas sp. GM95]SEM11841.1 Lysophospholipase L1 [Pseudoxanthomonas sp. GM95]